MAIIQINPITSVPIERYAARRDQRLAACKFPSFSSVRDYRGKKTQQKTILSHTQKVNLALSPGPSSQLFNDAHLKLMCLGTRLQKSSSLA